MAYDSSALKRQLEGMGGPTVLKAEALPGQMKTGALPEYDAIRSQVGQRAEAAKQGGIDALKRKFAAAGALNSGAAIKTQQIAEEQGNQQKEQAIQNVDFQEAQDRNQQNQFQEQLNESARGRNFQREAGNADRDTQNQMFKFDAGSKIAGLDLQFDQYQLAKDESEFNKKLEKYKAGRSGGLFGGGGFLGLGIGAKDADI